MNKHAWFLDHLHLDWGEDGHNGQLKRSCILVLRAPKWRLYSLIFQPRVFPGSYLIGCGQIAKVYRCLYEMVYFVVTAYDQKHKDILCKHRILNFYHSNAACSVM